jgi:sec-independent protein translocase protein TatB
MFGIGVPEMFVIALVAMLVFGPDKLPELARQAGKFVRTVRQMAENAKNDLGREMGEDFSGIDLKDLDPRELVRKNFLDDLDDKPSGVKEARILRPGETPPFDPEST